MTTEIPLGECNMRTNSKQAADAVSTATGALSRPTPHALHGPITSADASIELMRLINGYQVSQALHVAAVLGVADQLKDGPKSGDSWRGRVERIQHRFIDCSARWRQSVYFTKPPTWNSLLRG